MLRAVLMALVVAVVGRSAVSTPAVQSLHRDWTFNYLPASTPDLAIVAPTFDDSLWPAVALPHTWSTYETTREVHPFIQNASERTDPYWWKGWGVYRKRFIVPAALRDRLIFVEFDGVQKYARVFLNGHELGQQKGGYYGFSFELTPHLRYDGENVLVVLVSNRRDDPFGGIPPMTAGNFNVYGGIYRGVRLVVKDRLYIPFQGSPEHEGGTFITTPEVSADRGIVAIRTYVGNAYPESRTTRVVSRIIDPDGKLIQELATPLTVAPGQIAPCDQTSAPIAHPQLWSPATPALYSVETLVELDGRTVDRMASPLGLRWFRWDREEKRLYVNGAPVRIQGTNRHQEFPWLGDAMPRWMHERDLDDIRRNLAHNFMRTAHYPQDNSVYDLNDRLGIITVCEAPNIKAIEFGRDIQEANARAMVRRLRNHPGIFFWSVGNETTQAADSRWIWEEDQTRIIHARKAQQFGDYVTHDHSDLDMENLLRCTVRGWHDEDVPDLARLHPASGQVTGTEEWQHVQARIPGSNVRGVVNEQTVAWLYADHGCDRIYPNAPLKYLNPKGWVDAYRVPKYMYYLWQANWLDRPMVFVQPHHWRRQFLGQRKDFQVDSNCDEVELFANGLSQGVQRPTHADCQTVTFENVLVQDGVLRAEGRRAGHTVATWEVLLAGEPAKIVLRVERGDRFVADRAGIAEIRADIVDAAGVPVLGAHPTLEWEVDGPARLVGPARYESDIDRRGEAAGVWYIDTPISNLVRTTATPGTIRVRVSAPGLKAGEVTLESTTDDRTRPAGVVEPPLDDAGRRPVARTTGFIDQVEFKADIAPLRDSPRFGAQSPDGYRAALDRIIRQHNPAFRPLQPAYDHLLSKLAGQLAASTGTLIEDDFNYLAGLYNTCAHLSRVLDTLPMHPAYQQAWREHFARTIVDRGAPADAGDWTTFLRALPAQGRQIELTLAPGEKPATVYNKATYLHVTRAPNLESALGLLDPAYAAAPAPALARLREHLFTLNPWLREAGDTITLWLPDHASWRRGAGLANP